MDQRDHKEACRPRGDTIVATCRNGSAQQCSGMELIAESVVLGPLSAEIIAEFREDKSDAML